MGWYEQPDNGYLQTWQIAPDNEGMEKAAGEDTFELFPVHSCVTALSEQHRDLMDINVSVPVPGEITLNPVLFAHPPPSPQV